MWCVWILVSTWAGPATVFCDYLGYLFMFLSIATSNMVATALAKQVSSLFPFSYGIQNTDEYAFVNL
jgi:hypothetical protein